MCQKPCSPVLLLILLQVSFRHFNEYETYTYAVNDAEKKGKEGVTLSIKGDYLKVPPGKYILCYISKYKNWLRGMSNVFEVGDLGLYSPTIL